MTDRSRLRLVVMQVLVLSILGTLLGRLWFLQVHEGATYAVAANQNRVRSVVTPAPRGQVLDDQGRPLVAQRTALVVSVDRALLARAPHGGRDVLARLARIVGKTPAELRRQTTPCGPAVPQPCWAGSPYQPVPVQDYDARDAASLHRVLQISEHREDFPGVMTQFGAVATYPQGTLTAHVLGYTGPISQQETLLPQYRGVQASALVGRAGVEATYEPQLRGTDGVQQLLVDHVGTVTGTQGSTAPVPGSDLVLSLDAKVQKVAEDALQRAIVAARQRPYYRGGTTVADSGSIVVMQPSTGRIVAMASYPTYDPAKFGPSGISTRDYQAYTDPQGGQPLLFRAIGGAYAPASTFKAVTSSAVVMNGQATFDSLVSCPTRFAPTGQQGFEGQGYGTITLHRAIVVSCDTNFYAFAYDEWLADGGNTPVAHPRDPIVTMSLDYGLDRTTGVDLPGESPGLVPTRQWRLNYWKSLKADFCAGARNPAFPPEQRARDQDSCVDGYKFRGGQATNFAIGQGETLVTPLQLASVYATVANGGTIMRPTVAKALLSADGTTVQQVQPQVLGHVPVTPGVLADLRSALHGVTSEPGGTASGVFAGFPVAVAGKTGTGEVAGRQDTSWFASFAPYDHPDLVVVGMISQGGPGATTAAPMVRDVYAGIYGVGQPAALPGGTLPAALPRVRPDGTVGPPGTRVPVAPRVSTFRRRPRPTP